MDQHITTDAISWPTVEAYIQRRIALLRTELEDVPADLPARVAELQGRIRELRELLAAAEPEAPTVEVPNAY